MDSKHTKPIVSRRTRPAKPPLTREGIVATALDIIREKGVPGLSLRQIAAALDTGVASLYVYIANLEELHRLAFDLAMAAVTIPGGQERPWRERLKDLLFSYHATLSSYPGLAELALSTIFSGGNSLRIYDAMMGLLGESGIDDLRVVWGCDLLLSYVTAEAAEQCNWTKNDHAGVKRIRKSYEEVQESEYPMLFHLKAVLLSGDKKTRFSWSVDAILQGITSAS